MPNKTLQSIFKKGSKTYFYNSLFFPANVKDDVFALYSFVRKADDFVDAIPQQRAAFEAFRQQYQRSLEGEDTGDVVIESFTALLRKRAFDPEWVDAFLAAMEMDLHKHRYRTLEEVIEYMYGSAEVVGLMMAKIFDVDEKFYHNARLLGRAMQYINFIRDIAEDVILGRTYFPEEDMEAFGLQHLDYHHTHHHAAAFEQFVALQLSRYMVWQAEAEQGFIGLPKAARVPIANASDMYKWTAQKIEKDPFVVYRWKVKPSKARIITNLLAKKLFMGNGNGKALEKHLLVPETSLEN